MISLHIKVDQLSNAVLDRALQYLVRVNAHSVQITAGAEIQRGQQYLEGIRSHLPNAVLFWRDVNPSDGGIYARMTPQQVFNLKVAPYLDWYKRNKVVFMPDNESSGDDAAMTAYAQWEATFLGLLHNVGLNGAMCRFATGTIKESQYHLLTPIFNAMKNGDWLSPNEYSNAPGQSSAGHLERYKNMWTAAGRKLPVAIGEAGICVNYDPGRGYRSIGLSGSAYANQMISEEVWYLNGQIDRFLFVVGKGWDSFSLINEIPGGVEADTLDALEKYYAAHPPQPPMQWPPVITPPPIEPPPVITPPPTTDPIVTLLAVLQSAHDVLKTNADKLRSMSLAMAGMSDELNQESQVVAATIAKIKGKAVATEVDGETAL